MNSRIGLVITFAVIGFSSAFDFLLLLMTLPTDLSASPDLIHTFKNMVELYV